MTLPERFTNLTNEELQKLIFTDFLKSELMELIEETILTDLDRTIAILKFTRLKTNEEVAEEVLYDPKTVKSHARKTHRKLIETLLKLPKTKSPHSIENTEVN